MLAKSYEQAGAYKKAITTYDNVVNRHPESDRAAQALTNKARIQKDYLKNRIEAEETYKSLITQYHNVEGAEETIDDARRELESMGAARPAAADQLGYILRSRTRTADETSRA